MLLSVVVYKHKLNVGQWFGAAIVFAGIGVEAWVKRRGVYSLSLSACFQPPFAFDWISDGLRIFFQ